MKQAISEEWIELSIPHSHEYLRLIRLSVAGIGNILHFDAAEIEDIKLAVGEACYALMECWEQSGGPIHVRCRADSNRGAETLRIEISCRRCVGDEYLSSPSTLVSPHSALGAVLMRNLMDEVEQTVSDGILTVRLVKRRRTSVPSSGQMFSRLFGVEAQILF